MQLNSEHNLIPLTRLSLGKSPFRFLRGEAARQRYIFKRILCLFAVLVLGLPGCSTSKPMVEFQNTIDASHYEAVAQDVDFSTETTFRDDMYLSEVAATPSPLSILNNASAEPWNLNLEDVIHVALQQSKVMRDLGGLVLRSPDSLTTIQDPAISQTDPRFGTESALSIYDVNFSSSFFAEKNDRIINNIFAGGGTNLFNQDADIFQAEISKKTAYGTEFFLRNNTDYDSNNSPGNLFGSAWNTNIEAEARQPLLRGAGTTFNRIVGSSEVAGVANGIMIARVNAEISVVDFQVGVRNYVSDIENAYWDLYFSYRDLDAKIKARDAALETWRRIHSLFESGRRGGEAEKEARAREQYYRLQEDVQNALTGRLLEGTRTNNGSSGGTFRGTGGVHVAERRLRLLMGLPISDGRLIRPTEETLEEKILFNWDDCVAEALTNRIELHRQNKMIKRRELELTASREFLLPQLDAVGRYRWRGFGKDLYRQGDRKGSIDNAIENLTDLNFQEWQLGVELSFPIGNRQAHAAVRNAELLLARERAILREQERSVIHDLSNAVAESERAYAVVETSYNRRAAAREQLEAVQAAYEADQAPLNLVLEAQRRFADAESHYSRMLVEYTLAVKNVHFEKGTLLTYNRIAFSEGDTPTTIYTRADVADVFSGASDQFMQRTHSPVLETDGGNQPKTQTKMQTKMQPGPTAVYLNPTPFSQNGSSTTEAWGHSGGDTFVPARPSRPASTPQPGYGHSTFPARPMAPTSASFGHSFPSTRAP